MPAPLDDDQKPARRVQPPPREVWSNPRNVVPLAFVGLLAVAGGRRLYDHWRARRAIVRLDRLDVAPQEIRQAAQFGRSGLTEFFRLLAEGPTPEVRRAAGWALGRLWKRDDLVAEEEKQVAVRGFEVHWSARRRYPRAMDRPIPIVVRFGLGFLEPDGDGLLLDDLEWSARIDGGQRAGLESWGPWTSGEGRMAFAIEPGDFVGNGPHRLVLRARVRPTSNPPWELELPHIPFRFELDPLLEPSALLASAGVDRAEAFQRAVRLVATDDADPPTWLPVVDEWLVRNPPSIQIESPLPCDLAHAAVAEFEGLAGSIPIRPVVVDGQPGSARCWTFPLGPEPIAEPADRPALDRPGVHRLRVVLRPDADLGWASPDVRSVWPQPIVTDWVEVRVVRR